ncbi:MAG: glutaredoxin family protein [bacterium]|nr:glutaredoxin family protein [bacterium]
MNIIIYTKEGCGWCTEVINLLRSKNIPFEERNCTVNAQYFDELVQKSGQFMTPTLDIDGEIIADTDVQTVTSIFKKKGILGF